MNPLVGAFLVLLLGLALIVLEMFIPSSGLLTFLAVTSLVASIAIVFVYQGLAWGAIYLACVCVMLPVLAVLLVRWWPKTPIGRRMLNLPAGNDDDEATGAAKTGNRMTQLVGQCGHAKTKMLPSGAIEVAGRTYDAVSEGVAIDLGQPVEVIEVSANRIVVRPARDFPAAAPGPKTADDQPLDTVVPDPFDDPIS